MMTASNTNTAASLAFCACCGTIVGGKRPTCFRGCAAEKAVGTMADALARQGDFAKAEAAKAAAAPAAVESDYAAQVRAARAETAQAAKVAQATKTARSSRPVWQRRCTCGHCMACIGE